MAWKNILLAYEKEGNNVDALLAGDAAGNTASLINADKGENVELEQLKDQLFIKTGEDQYDCFLAFNHYGLNTELTDNDRKNNN